MGSADLCVPRSIAQVLSLDAEQLARVPLRPHDRRNLLEGIARKNKERSEPPACHGS